MDQGSKLKSFGALIISSLMPAGIYFLWSFSVLSTSNTGVAGLAFLYIGFILTIPVILMSIGEYYLITKLLSIARLHKATLLLPILSVIILMNWAILSQILVGTLYAGQYESLKPEVTIVEERLAGSETSADIFLASYHYKVNIHNNENRVFPRVPLVVEIGYINKNSPETDHKSFGVDTKSVEINPGDNIIKGEVKIDTFPVKRDHFVIRDKIRLWITFTLPKHNEYLILDTNQQINKDLQDFANKAKSTDEI